MASRCLAQPPPNPDPRIWPEDSLACGRLAGHDGRCKYQYLGYLQRQDPRLVTG